MKSNVSHKKLVRELNELDCLVNKRALKALKKLAEEAVEEAFLAGERKGMKESADAYDNLIDKRLTIEKLLYP